MGDLVLGKQKGLFWGDRVGGGGGSQVSTIENPLQCVYVDKYF